MQRISSILGACNMQIRNSKLCEASKCWVYSAVNHPWWMGMLFHRRGLLWLGSAACYNILSNSDHYYLVEHISKFHRLTLTYTHVLPRLFPPGNAPFVGQAETDARKEQVNNWPHVRQTKFCLRVCQGVFLGVLPFSPTY